MINSRQRIHKHCLAAAVIGVALCAGCETEAPTPIELPKPPAPAAAAPPAQAAPVAQTAPAAVAAPEPKAAAAPPAAEANAPAENPVAAPPAEEMVRKKAQPGVGVKGKDIPQELGTTAVKQYFLVKEKTVFDMQVPSALNLYKAEKGYGPRSHEEFMEQIVKANQIPLPPLPPGQRYLWDPEKQELFVEHPKR